MVAVKERLLELIHKRTQLRRGVDQHCIEQQIMSPLDYSRGAFRILGVLSGEMTVQKDQLC
jgi:hypothetical protein